MEPWPVRDKDNIRLAGFMAWIKSQSGCFVVKTGGNRITSLKRHNPPLRWFSTLLKKNKKVKTRGNDLKRDFSPTIWFMSGKWGVIADLFNVARVCSDVSNVFKHIKKNPKKNSFVREERVTWALECRFYLFVLRHWGRSGREKKQTNRVPV